MPNRVTAAESSAAIPMASSREPRERSVVILDAETLQVVGFDSVPGAPAPPTRDSGEDVRAE